MHPYMHATVQRFRGQNLKIAQPLQPAPQVPERPSSHPMSPTSHARLYDL